MSDIVERLRGAEPCREAGGQCRTMEARSGCCCAAAADEIERLTAERDRMQDAVNHALSLAEAEGDRKRALQGGIAKLERVWFSGIDLDKDAIAQECLTLFRHAREVDQQNASNSGARDEGSL